MTVRSTGACAAILMLCASCATASLNPGGANQCEVFAVGTCKWVVGLEQQDPFVERIMRNVLDRFAR